MNTKTIKYTLFLALLSLFALLTVVLPAQAAPLAHPSADYAYYSFKANGTISNVNYRDEDVLALNLTTNVWELVFDGSAVGVTKDVDAVAWENGALLLSFKKETAIPGISGLVDDSDIVKFTPTAWGKNTTAGTFTLYFDGSDVGLTTNGEDVDGISFGPDNRIFITTSGPVRVLDVDNNQLRGRDEDILIFRHTTLGDNTTGYFEPFLDGTELDMNDPSEDIWAIDYQGSFLYMSTKNSFNVQDQYNTNYVGNGVDLIGVSPYFTSSTNPNFEFALSNLWVGANNNIPATESIDGLATLYGQ